MIGGDRGFGHTTGRRRHLQTSRPWFYPVVEQHDVTYHRVKPLTGHRRQTQTQEDNYDVQTPNEQLHPKQETFSTSRNMKMTNIEMSQ